MSHVKIVIGIILIIIDMIIAYQELFNNVFESMDELLDNSVYWLGMTFLPVIFLMCGGLLIKHK